MATRLASQAALGEKAMVLLAFGLCLALCLSFGIAFAVVSCLSLLIIIILVQCPRLSSSLIVVVDRSHSSDMYSLNDA